MNEQTVWLYGYGPVRKRWIIYGVEGSRAEAIRKLIPLWARSKPGGPRFWVCPMVVGADAQKWSEHWANSESWSRGDRPQ